MLKIESIFHFFSQIQLRDTVCYTMCSLLRVDFRIKQIIFEVLYQLSISINIGFTVNFSEWILKILRCWWWLLDWRCLLEELLDWAQSWLGFQRQWKVEKPQRKHSQPSPKKLKNFTQKLRALSPLHKRNQSCN